MTKLSDALTEAIRQTLQLQDPDSEEYHAWLKDPLGPFAPTIPAADNSGSYPTTTAVMSDLATIADTLLKNDADFKITINRDTARMEAARTLGELLPIFAKGETGQEWKQFRERFRERLEDRRGRITHYMPVWLFVRQQAPAFPIGPVTFMQRDAWLREIERRRGEPSSWMPAVRDVWSGEITFADLQVQSARTAAKSVRADQWVAAVTIDRFEPAESYNRAVIAIRVALDTLRLLMPSPHNRRIATAADHRPPVGLDRLSQVDNHDLAVGTSLNVPGVSGAPGMAASLISGNRGLLDAAGRRIEVSIAPDPLSLKDRCPRLSDRWVNAAHWFGRACQADVDFAALVMLIFSMDVLSGGLEDDGIAELSSRLFGIDREKEVLPGVTLNQLVIKSYKYRSEIAHGSILAIDKNFSDERMHAEQLAQAMLRQYVLQLDKYAAAGGDDDRDAFCTSLPQPKAGL
jgi:hypothetical protein